MSWWDSASTGREQWLRTAMYRSIDARVDAIGPQRLDAVEISGSEHQGHPWHSYTSLAYPEFDLCAEHELLEQFDVVFCDQVLEHVLNPVSATQTLFEMCRPGGLCVVATPFLYKIHAAPDDYWRFTPHGITALLSRAGFVDIETESWGNRSCIQGNFARDLPQKWWRSLRAGDPALPIVVWAFARRPR